MRLIEKTARTRITWQNWFFTRR